VASYADSIDQAKAYVEAGAEFFAVFRRNPYQEG
jgi:2-methylisocitrate lyase-like PEP mutase family enzyme